MIAIVICSLGIVRLDWALHMYSSQVSMGNTYQYIASTGKTVCDARNLGLTDAIVNKKADKILFWDDDVLPRNAPTAVHKLSVALDTYPEIDIIGGVYPQKSTNPELRLPIVFTKFGEPSWWGFEDGNIHEVYMTATGFMMLRASSMLKLDNLISYELEGQRVTKYFDVTAEERTDDFYFARIAKENGLKWFVHGGVICDQIDLQGNIHRYEDSKPPELIRAWQQDKPSEKQ